MEKRDIFVNLSFDPAVGERTFELVERKGIGHPDSICDGIVESVCNKLCRYYRERFGRILHHNIDKGLLVAGRSSPRLGGGKVDEPMRFIFGDRGIAEYQGVKVPVGEIAREAAAEWLKNNLRFVNPDTHMLYQNEIRPGTAELVANLQGEQVGANDTSVGVGYAPLSPTEKTVLAVERWLNSPSFKQSFPESGEDIKIMGLRVGRRLQLIVAMAFVDAYVQCPGDYLERKRLFQAEITSYVAGLQLPFDEIVVELNSLDNPALGEDGMYLTVIGTSAESGDSGEVGRGNRVNGIIAYNRPSTTEAAAGKNPINHTGKIYNLLSHRLAAKVFAEIGGMQELTVWLCSRIGAPLDTPVLAGVQISPLAGVGLRDLEDPVRILIAAELAHLEPFFEQMQMGEFGVF